MKVAVVGGGISGVSIAALLHKKTSYSVTLIEKGDIGGKATTLAREGYLIENGPNGFLDNKKEIKQLIEEFGFDSSVIESNDSAKRRFIFSKSRLHELPDNPIMLMFDDLLGITGRLRLLKEPFIKPLAADETLYDFVVRRLGVDVLNKLIGPMACGVYAADPRYIGMDAAFGRIKEIERLYGSLIKGLISLSRQKKATAKSTSGPFSAKLLSFKDGIGGFIKNLADNLNIIKDRVLSLEKIDGRYRIYTSRSVLDADIVIFAVPSYNLSSILQSIDSEFAHIAGSIEYAPLSVVSFGLDKQGLPDIVNSFGYLFDLNEIKDVIGVLFDSSMFMYRAPNDRLLVRVMAGGAMRKESALKKDIITSAISELQRSAAIYKPFDFSYVKRHIKAIPQYGLNHNNILNDIDAFEDSNKGLFITGNAFYGVSINDCVKSAYNIFDKVV